MVNLTNCCYPPEEAITYNVNANLILQDGVQVNGHEIQVKLSPGQNINTMDFDTIFATQFPVQIFYVTYNSIQRV